jgi:hypothetical protein
MRCHAVLCSLWNSRKRLRTYSPSLAPSACLMIIVGGHSHRLSSTMASPRPYTHHASPSRIVCGRPACPHLCKLAVLLLRSHRSLRLHSLHGWLPGGLNYVPCFLAGTLGWICRGACLFSCLCFVGKKRFCHGYCGCLCDVWDLPDENSKVYPIRGRITV